MHGENEGDGLLDVVEDAPAEPHGSDDRREVVIEQHERCGLACDVGSAASHGDADVCRLERGSVVDAIARHRDDLSVQFERGDEAELLLRDDAGEHVHVFDAP